MSTATCSQCGAPLRADQPWCSLCFARVPEPFDPLTAPLEELAGQGEPAEADAATPPTLPTVPTVPTATVSRGRHSADALPSPGPSPGPSQGEVHRRTSTAPAAEAEFPEEGLWQPPSWMALPQTTADSLSDTAAATSQEHEDDSTEVTDIDVMFSMLSAEHRATDPTSALAGRLDDRSTRMAIMVGGALIVGALLFLVFTLLGAIF